MKKKIVFLVVCLMLVASSAFAEHWAKPLLQKSVLINIKARQAGIAKDRLLMIMAKHRQSFIDSHENEPEIIKAWLFLEKLNKQILNDAFNFPIGSTDLEKETISKTFILKWNVLIDEHL
jgi:hypothetical protein